MKFIRIHSSTELDKEQTVHTELGSYFASLTASILLRKPDSCLFS